MKYYVSITEFLNKVVSVNADSEAEAVQRVRDAYLKNDIVLTSDDYVDNCIEVEEDQDYYHTEEANGTTKWQQL